MSRHCYQVCPETTQNEPSGFVDVRCEFFLTAFWPVRGPDLLVCMRIRGAVGDASVAASLLGRRKVIRDQWLYGATTMKYMAKMDSHNTSTSNMVQFDKSFPAETSQTL